MRRSTRVTTQAVLDEVVAQDLSPDVFADGHRALRSVPCAGAHSPTNRRASPVNTHVVADRAGAEVAVHRGCRFGGHRRARLALESSLAGEFSTAWGASGTLMRHFLSASPFAAPVPVAALALGVTVPAASRALIPASRRAQALTPGEVAAIGPAVLLAPVAARADEHLASASGTQKQSGIVHRPPRRGGLDDPQSPGNTALGAVRKCGSGRSLGRDRQVNSVRGCAGLPGPCDLTATPQRRHRTGAQRRHLRQHRFRWEARPGRGRRDDSVRARSPFADHVKT